ncbi:MAG: hypothetical protein H6832_05770 [Planctomycetes bacterium]|nr:hypothetical protein [Planctomycetota bacterium]MCB9891611.1 hypothetical protein [Planctomycetota bacterium]MCB9917892.1 hypothetical protein [Planctomycetota bacterium]
MSDGVRVAAPFWFECQADGWQHFDPESWGACRRWIEVLEDQKAARQIDRYECGRVLVYDRAHARDRFGMLIGLTFSNKAKWQKFFAEVSLSDVATFEKAWRRALREADNRPGDDT